MQKPAQVFLVVAVALSALAAGSSASLAADVTFERLLNPEPHNWLMVNRDFTAQRHSTLDQINKSNIKNMKLQFAVAIGGTSPNEGLQVTPLVAFSRAVTLVRPTMPCLAAT